MARTRHYRVMMRLCRKAKTKMQVRSVEADEPTRCEELMLSVSGGLRVGRNQVSEPREDFGLVSPPHARGARRMAVSGSPGDRVDIPSCVYIPMKPAGRMEDESKL